MEDFFESKDVKENFEKDAEVSGMFEGLSVANITHDFSYESSIKNRLEHQGESNLPLTCKRSGVFGFIIPPGIERSTLLCDSRLSPTIWSEEHVPEVYVGGHPAVRFRFPYTVERKFRIPQLLGYIPQTGVPFYEYPESYSRKLGGADPYSKLRYYHVVIPVQHILHMLGEFNVTHHMSVFNLFGDVEDSSAVLNRSNLKTWYSGKHAIPDYLGGSIPAFVTDEFSAPVEFKDFIQFTTPKMLEVLSGWRSSGGANNAIASEHLLPNEIMETFLPPVDCPIPLEMTNDDFARYLPFWMIAYPQKFKTIKHEYAGPSGHPDLENPGYTNYMYHPKAKILFGTQNLHSAYFGVDSIQPILANVNMQQYESAGFQFTMRSQCRKGTAYVAHKANSLLPPRMLESFVVLRRLLDTSSSYKDIRKYFPFSKITRRPMSDHPLGLNTHINARDYANIARIMAVRLSLQKNMQLVKRKKGECPKCNKALLLPSRIANSTTLSSKVVCWPCGVKYLVNYVNCLMPGSWLAFKHHSLSEVIDYDVYNERNEDD